ncbi:hypothetical protein UGMREWDR_CDS0032 [Aeromonas phage GomatiRiver_11]|nr:hypothetical protein OBDJBBDK_00031 [Aeromonas phage AhFM11]WKW84199.1 hypothetical protein UGMREWDR_CDS0032 [Aeromonas phage GomatiRiver_11]
MKLSSAKSGQVAMVDVGTQKFKLEFFRFKDEVKALVWSGSARQPNIWHGGNPMSIDQFERDYGAHMKVVSIK